MQSATELFDFTSTGKVMLKPTASNRIEFYDNGPDCKKPVTQYGLVLDIDNSKKRWNLNFGVISLQELYDMQESTKCRETYHAINKLISRFVEDDIWNHPNAHITLGKRNALAGTGQHNLSYSKAAFDPFVGAILLLTPGQPPAVHLFRDGVEEVFDADWERVTRSSHPAKQWQVRF